MFAARNEEECIAWTKVCVAICCRLLQCGAAVCCSVLQQCVAVCCSVLVFVCSQAEMKKSVVLGPRCVVPCVAVCCSVLQQLCSVLQCVILWVIHMFAARNEKECIAWTKVRVAVCCSVLQCVAVHCSVLQQGL